MSIVHRVLFIRHGETEANIGGYFSGQTNSDLTELGKEMTHHAAAAVVGFRPDRVFVSPILRCQAIAKEAAKSLDIEPVTLDVLGEMDFGEMEGKPIAYLKHFGIRFPWPRNDEGLSQPCPGGETFEHAYGRAAEILDMVRNGTGRTVCITHGGIMRCILGVHLGIPYERIWDIRLVNVSSMLLTCTDMGRVWIEGIGFNPEEVIERTSQPSMYDPFGAFNELGEKS